MSDSANVERTGGAPTRVLRMRFPAVQRTSIAAFGLGAVSVAGYAPLYLFPIPLLALTALVLMWQRATSPRRAAMLGWWFGLGFFLTGVSWVYVSLNTFGAMPAPLAAIATLLFCAYLALFPAAVGYGYARIKARPWIRMALLAPALWTLAEWTRGWFMSGFPWLALGYSQVPMSPLAWYAPIIGIYGVTLAAAATAGLSALLLQRLFSHDAAADPRLSTAARARILVRHPALLLIAALWIGGEGLRHVVWTTPAGEPITVSLLQGNIPQEIKWREDGLRKTLLTYRQLTLESPARLIVLPETALPLFLHSVPPEYLNELASHARRNDGDVLIGVPERAPDGSYYNSVISIGTAATQVYRKSHLVPFGEFIPLRPVLGWIVNILSIPMQDFSRGSLTQQRPMAVAGQRVAVNICYEDAFGEEIIQQLPEATLLVNVSNVAWFGRSIAPRQHLQISQARAMETGRYMLRSTNTGMTAIIDQRGRLVDVAPQFELAALTGPAQGYTGATPYVRWGNTPLVVLCFALLAAALIAAYFRAR
jgi:apolipoprotein N-acyltransferase